MRQEQTEAGFTTREFWHLCNRKGETQSCDVPFSSLPTFLDSCVRNGLLTKSTDANVTRYTPTMLLRYLSPED